MLTEKEVLDRYFPEVRARLLEIAAAIDRYNRANSGNDKANLDQDQRLEMFKASLDVLSDKSSETDKAERIQMIFSDPYPAPKD